MFSSFLISTCNAHKPRGNTKHTMQHTPLYISGQIQKICFLQFNILICLLIILFKEKKLKTVMHLSFAKSLSWSLFLGVFLVLETVFARFAMGFNGFFSLFCQVLGGFWWVLNMVLMEKEYAYIYVGTQR